MIEGSRILEYLDLSDQNQGIADSTMILWSFSGVFVGAKLEGGFYGGAN